MRQRGPRRWTGWVGRNWARVTYARHVEPTWLELTQHHVTVADLPPEFDGFRVVHLTDLHASHSVPTSLLVEAIELANSQQPDLIAVTGDFVHAGYRHVERVARIVSRLEAPSGVYAVLGNHDYSVRNALGLRRFPRLPDTIAAALTQQGVRVLRNESVTIRRGESILHLVGVDDLWSRVCNVSRAFAGLAPDVPRVLLAHNPRTIARLADQRCDLQLSGHTHGGQVDWPGLGRFLLTRKNRRLAAGMYRCGNVALYVNRGVGFGFRFRYKVRPEVAVIHLNRGS
jgi:predicted MPP superfamily phosphohydrolase